MSEQVEPRGSASDPSETCTCFAIRRAARQVTGLYDDHLAAVGITVGQYSILRRLSSGDPLTINELAGALGTDRTTMSRTVRPLERDGLVTIASNPADKRRRALTITPAGRVRRSAARERWAAAQDQIDRLFGAARARDLRNMLAALSACGLSEGAAQPSLEPTTHAG